MADHLQEQLFVEMPNDIVVVDPPVVNNDPPPREGEGDIKMTRICATSPTGLEQVAAEEVQDKLNTKPDVTRGKIFFNIPLASIKELKKLCAVDNLSVVVWQCDSMDLTRENKDDVLTELTTLPSTINWKEGLNTWQIFTDSTVDINYCQPLTSDKSDDKSNDVVSSANPDGDTASRKIPKFRATCNRVGTNHKFSSMEAACHFGGGYNDHFGWDVSMKDFDVNILINILDNSMTLSLALTDSSLHRRFMTNFGATTLRSTIAYSLLRLSTIQPGDVICDPMCGSGSIPIEACMSWPSCLTMCGDNADVACDKSYSNIESLHANSTLRGNRDRPNVDVLQWDATNLPLPGNMVDVIVSDLPFGKRMGSKFNNRLLYPKLLREMGRVCKPKTGRATLMTQDTKSMRMALMKCSSLWSHKRTVWVNVGGLSVGVFLLMRTMYQLDNR